MKFIKSALAAAAGLAMIAGSSAVAVPQAQAAVHGAGTNVVSNGTIYMITDSGQRRPYTSAGAYLSYGFNSWANAVPASPEDMMLPEGAFIPPRDGKIVCSDRGTDKGTCYLITNAKRAAFSSASVFTGLGFSFKKALYGDVSFLPKEADITSSAQQHHPGVLINRYGTVYLVSSSGGLLGIPSLEVLGTWGYSLNDIVPANSFDLSLTQTSVISARQGAKLQPEDPGTADLTEDVIVKSYLDTHPALPKTESMSQADAALVLNVAKAVSDAKDLAATMPYLSSRSLELLSKSPEFKSRFEEKTASLVGLSVSSSKVSIYEGNQVATYAENLRQEYTDYTKTDTSVYVKEGGVWKFDLIGTIKFALDQSLARNPSGDWVRGSGMTDIAMREMEYSDNPRVNDPNTVLYVVVKNNGQTTIETYRLIIEVNSFETIATNRYDELLPGQSVALAIPLDTYWQSPAVTMKTPGSYRTDVSVELYPSGLDMNTSNNSFYNVTEFK